MAEERETQTPKKGYKSITVKADVYDYFFTEWLKVKDDYAIKKRHPQLLSLHHLPFSTT